METVKVETGKIDWKVEMLGLERDLRQSGKGQNRATEGAQLVLLSVEHSSPNNAMHNLISTKHTARKS